MKSSPAANDNLIEKTRMPKPARLFDKVVVCGGRWFHPKTSRPASRRSVLLASGLGFAPMTLDLRDLHLVRPHSRDRFR